MTATSELEVLKALQDLSAGKGVNILPDTTVSPATLSTDIKNAHET